MGLNFQTFYFNYTIIFLQFYFYCRVNVDFLDLVIQSHRQKTKDRLIAAWNSSSNSNSRQSSFVNSHSCLTSIVYLLSFFNVNVYFVLFHKKVILNLLGNFIVKFKVTIREKKKTLTLLKYQHIFKQKITASSYSYFRSS